MPMRVGKEEMSDKGGTLPHLQEETRAGDMVRKLEIEDCAALFDDIRNVGTREANARVSAYMEKYKE